MTYQIQILWKLLSADDIILVQSRLFLRKMLGTRYGPDFSDSRDPIFSDFRDPMIIFSDSGDPVWNSNALKRLKKNLVQNDNNLGKLQNSVKRQR